MKIPKEILELSEESLVEQVIEEAGEMIQVLSKRLRISRGENFTPVPKDVNFRNLVEEFNDLSLCMEVLNIKYHGKLRNRKSIGTKLKRWQARLCGRKL